LASIFGQSSRRLCHFNSFHNPIPVVNLVENQDMESR
jgi:hypothetical protein